jgi:hypothetical protein
LYSDIIIARYEYESNMLGVLAPLTTDRLRGRERVVFVSTPDPYHHTKLSAGLAVGGESWGPRMPIITSLSRADYGTCKIKRL